MYDCHGTTWHLEKDAKNSNKMQFPCMIKQEKLSILRPAFFSFALLSFVFLGITIPNIVSLSIAFISWEFLGFAFLRFAFLRFIKHLLP